MVYDQPLLGCMGALARLSSGRPFLAGGALAHPASCLLLIYDHPVVFFAGHDMLFVDID